MKLWSIQALRFFAAALVVHLHAASSVANRTGDAGALGSFGTQFGASGVDLFFVISGLIITLTARDLTPLAFAAKRARRILPLWWLAVLPWFALAAAQGGVGWREAVASLGLWPATDHITSPALGVGWTLCFEALFYAAFAVVLWRRWTVWPLLAGYAAALAVGRGALLDYLGNPLILEFLFGVGLALMPRWRFGVWLMPLGVVLLVALTPLAKIYGTDVDFLRGNGNWSRVLAYGLPAALIVYGALHWEMRKGFLTELGDASYAIYLFHVPMVLAVGGVLNTYTALSADAAIAISVAVAIVIGWRVHVLFEKPILTFLSRRRKLAPVGAA